HPGSGLAPNMTRAPPQTDHSQRGQVTSASRLDLLQHRVLGRAQLLVLPPLLPRAVGSSPASPKPCEPISAGPLRSASTTLRSESNSVSSLAILAFRRLTSAASSLVISPV